MKHRSFITRLMIMLAAVGISWGGWRWWTAPPIDRRLVGEWEQIGERVWFVERQLKLRSSGRIIDSDKANDGLPELGFPMIAGAHDEGYHLAATWTVNENRLLLKYRYGRRIDLWILQVWHSWTSPNPGRRRPAVIHKSHEYEIVELTSSRLVLRTSATGLPSNTAVFRRLEPGTDVP